MKPAFYISFMLLLLPSCSKPKDTFGSVEEIEAYLNDRDNGYISSVETSDFIVESKFVPALAGDANPQVTMHLRISRKDGKPVLETGGAGTAEILQREQYLSFEALSDAYLEGAGQLVPAGFHHYERNYGLKPSVDLYFQFKAMQPDEAVYFNYRDQLFDQGLIRIKINHDLFKTCHVNN